jgi:AcrR family transcriptional regulator
MDRATKYTAFYLHRQYNGPAALRRIRLEEKRLMPRHADPELEERILNAAHTLWHRGGDKALTLRAVARAARTNTPAMYRRFKNRQDLVRGLLVRFTQRIREDFEARETIEGIAEAYVELAMRQPNEYELFYAHAEYLPRPKGRGRPIRESRPNFGLVEKRLAERLGGRPEDHTRLALAMWAPLHGTTTLLLSKGIPEGHEAELRSACRTAVRALLDSADKFPEEKRRRRPPVGRSSEPRAGT